MSAPRIHATCFSFQAKNAFLTYPHCDLEPSELVNILWGKFENRSPIYCVCSRELHEDGTFHLHVLLQCRLRINSRSPHCFDTSGYHPNIQAARDCRAVHDYVRKDPVTIASRGTFVEGRPGSSKESPNMSNSKDTTMRDIIKHSTSREEYLSQVREKFPFDWATKLSSFQQSASYLFPDIQEQYVSPVASIDLTCHERISDWLRDDLFTVSSFSYSLITGKSDSDARSDLDWMADHTRSELLEQGGAASTSADQQGQARLHGHAV